MKDNADRIKEKVWEFLKEWEGEVFSATEKEANHALWRYLSDDDDGVYDILGKYI